MQGEDVNATTELEKVLKALNSDPDALLLMGRLLPHVTTGLPTQQRLDLLKDGAMHLILNPDIQVCSQTSLELLFLVVLHESCRPRISLKFSGILRALRCVHCFPQSLNYH